MRIENMFATAIFVAMSLDSWTAGHNSAAIMIDVHLTMTGMRTPATAQCALGAIILAQRVTPHSQAEHIPENRID
jgi:hypothetical protein